MQCAVCAVDNEGDVPILGIRDPTGARLCRSCLQFSSFGGCLAPARGSEEVDEAGLVNSTRGDRLALLSATTAAILREP